MLRRSTASDSDRLRRLRSVSRCGVRASSSPISPATLPVGVVSLAYSQAYAFQCASGWLGTLHPGRCPACPQACHGTIPIWKIVGTPTAAGREHRHPRCHGRANRLPQGTTSSVPSWRTTKFTIADHVWADVNNNGTKDVGADRH